MNRKMLAASVALAGLLTFAVAGGAQAAYDIPDDTKVWGYQNGNPTSSSTYAQWRDQIPVGDTNVPGFKTDGIDYSYDPSAGTIVLEIYTNWLLGQSPSGAKTGNVWLDLDQNGSFERAIVLDNSTSGFGVGLYENVTWKTVNQLYAGSSNIVGGKYCETCTEGQTSPDFSAGQDTLSIITAGTNSGLGVTAVNFPVPPNPPPGTGNGIRVTISGLTSDQLALFNDGFGIGWGTGDCGNDTIVGDYTPGGGDVVVPIPAALPLMLGALAGLGLVARRRNKETV